MEDTSTESEMVDLSNSNSNSTSQGITEPLPIPRGNKNITPINSPIISMSPGGMGIWPHPIITKRTRTNSTYERAKDNPIERGIVKYFSRTKGHGFIMSDHRNGDEVFVHISDIDGEFVPRQGDEVMYRVCPIPPKLEKYQAIHVQIVNFTPEVHLRWDSPLGNDEKSDDSPDHYVT